MAARTAEPAAQSLAAAALLVTGPITVLATTATHHRCRRYHTATHSIIDATASRPAYRLQESPPELCPPRAPTPAQARPTLTLTHLPRASPRPLLERFTYARSPSGVPTPAPSGN